MFNRFWRNTRTEKHRPDDPLNTDPPPASVPPAPASAKKYTCVGCGCVMTADGQDIWHMGEKYKTFQKQAETITKKDEEISRLTSELATVKQELAALRSSGSAVASHRPGARVHTGAAGS